MSKVHHAGIAGVGLYVPEKRLTNADLEKMVDTSDEWITTRSGIKERRLCAPEEATSDLGAKAILKALENAGVKPEDVDAIICATFTPDTLCPSTACHIQAKIGAKNALAFDLEAACSGFLYGLTIAKSLITTGVCKTAVVLGAEAMSRFTDYQDRTTCVLFGDGAGAVVVQADAPQGRILSEYLGADGTLAEQIIIPAGGSRLPSSHETLDQKKHYIKMAGNEVFKFAVRILADSVEEALKRCGRSISDLNLIIPHQANYRILDAAARRMGLPEDMMYHNIAYHGNTSAATIPIALTDALQEGKIKKNDLLGLVAFGGGLTWGAAIIEW